MFDKDGVESALAGFEAHPKRKRSLPSKGWFLENLKYWPDSGEFEWLVNRKRYPKGTFLPCIRKREGYRAIKLPGGGKNNRVAAHRVAFLLMEGRWPIVIDHLNGDKQDNRWENLREVSTKENAKNMPLQKNNTSGTPGVFRVNNKWRGLLRVDGKRIHLGYFDTYEEAAKARTAANEKYGFHENHGRQ